MPWGSSTPPATVSRCVVCDGIISPNDPKVARQITGWVVSRSGGGVNQVKKMTNTGHYCHVACLPEATEPGRGEQSALF